MEACHGETEMFSGIDGASKGSTSRERGTNGELTGYLPLVLLHSESHAGNNMACRIINTTIVCSGHIWIHAGCLASQMN